MEKLRFRPFLQARLQCGLQHSLCTARLLAGPFKSSGSVWLREAALACASPNDVVFSEMQRIRSQLLPSASDGIITWQPANPRTRMIQYNCVCVPYSIAVEESARQQDCFMYHITYESYNYSLLKPKIPCTDLCVLLVRHLESWRLT